MNDKHDRGLIDLGAASVETRGGPEGFVDTDGTKQLIGGLIRD